MKKKLLMAAVGAALVAGPMVAAHAAGATLYGHMHLSMDRYDNDTTEDGYMANNSSRFGFKGDEDLGGGLKAIYQAESGVFAIDEGSGFGGTLRNTFVGFSGGWGAVKLGRHDTPYKDLGRKLDNFNEQIGDMRTMIGNGDAADGTGAAITALSFDQRVSNMIRYESPSFAGLNVVVQHTSNNGAETLANTNNKDNSLGVNWSSGPLFLGAAWNERGTAVADQEESGLRFAGSYTFNDFMIGLLWESLSDVGGSEGNDRDAMGLVASMKMGNNKFKFHWLDADKSDNAATDNGGDMLAIGVDHIFSKTAMVYLNYVKVSNDAGASFQPASGLAGHGDNLASVTGDDASAFSAGYILKF